jgi:lysophospholipid acyltransferase (LPLAT)-like uncharacterized protein
MISADASSKAARIDKSVERAYSFSSLKAYSFWDRLLIRSADLAFYLLINLIGVTVRWKVENWRNFEAASAGPAIPIYTFWHNRVFLATYFWRRRGIVVMTSQSFDGEYIARFIQRFGYGAARGSSTRGGVGAIVEMARLMRTGLPTAFTIDGPKGPQYVAKMGAVLLAKKTGHPILPFSITPARFFKVRSWDEFQIPVPFTRVLVDIGAPITVPGDADENLLREKRDELQRSLDTLTKKGEQWRKSASYES